MRIDETTVSAPAETPLPVGFVPTPTMEYRINRKIRRLTHVSAVPMPRLPAPIPVPTPIPPKGARALIWKQDPSVAEIGIRKVFLPGPVLAGPRDARISIQGPPPVSPNAMGD